MNIIFDLDGTLFQTRIGLINAVNHFFEQKGWEQIPKDRILCNIGKNSIQFLNNILPVGVMGQDVYEEFLIYERREIENKALLFDGVEQMLSNLTNEKHRLFLCSTGSEEYIRLVLEKTGIEKLFDHFVSAKYTTKTEAILNLLDENGFAVMIGDTITDFQAAINYHIPSIGVSYGYGNNEECEQATFLADNTEEITAYIKQIEIFRVLMQKIEAGNKRIVGINGVDTSGKSIFTDNFAKFIRSIGKKATVLHMDDYHNKRELRLSGSDEIHAYYEHAFNYEQIITELIVPLKDNGSINKRIMCLNLDTDRYENEIIYNITPDTILLIEGVLLFREPLNQYIDYKIYLQIDFEEVMRRAEIRDVPKYGRSFLQKYKDKYIPIQKMYIADCNPVHNSDVVIQNQNYMCPWIDRWG